jgi:tRNA dimethylallyltransferase
MTDGTTCAWFLVGPTASGKSAVVQHIAEHHGQLIVSADSMNLYRGMDVGTAKPSADDQAKADYAGINIAEPAEKFSVAAYLEAVRPAFESGRDIIVTGGTGLYVKCLTEGFDDVAPENEELRTELEALDFHALEKRAKSDAGTLYDALTVDDRQNPRRLIRILEKIHGGTPSPASTDSMEAVPPANYGRSWNSGTKAKIVGLHVERDVLHQRIEKRVERMYGAGLLDEARRLLGRDLSATARQAIGYAEAIAVLNNKMSLDDAKERTVVRTRQLAKRQMTWFRNQLNVEWIDTAGFPTLEQLADAVREAWKQTGPAPVVLN